MVEQFAVQLIGVGKRYRLFASRTHQLLEAIHPLRKKYHQEFWALRGIDLDVRKGETLGILGYNGSGKTTLLKVISSIARPNEGQVHITGSIAALLELGAGFNPEMTGRQNAHFYCSLLGVPGKEAGRLLPAIENFAGIGPFFDQPVKNYSLGMFMRLAFSAAIYVDPDILILDEVLAVGDARFQRKCFEKFRELQQRDMTIIIVTHSPELVTRFCDRAILLDKGRLLKQGKPGPVTEYYQRLIYSDNENNMELPSSQDVPASNSRGAPAIGDITSRFGSMEDNTAACSCYNPEETRGGNGDVSILNVSVLADGKPLTGPIDSGTNLDILFRVFYRAAVKAPIYNLVLKTPDGVTLYATSSQLQRTRLLPAQAGEEAIVSFNLHLPLAGGWVFIDLGVSSNEGGRLSILDCRYGVLAININPTPRFTGVVDLGISFNEVLRQK
jgi:lipopolysaccharide transport system ATP-binding protein